MGLSSVYLCRPIHQSISQSGLSPSIFQTVFSAHKCSTQTRRAMLSGEPMSHGNDILAQDLEHRNSQNSLVPPGPEGGDGVTLCLPWPRVNVIGR